MYIKISYNIIEGQGTVKEKILHDMVQVLKST